LPIGAQLRQFDQKKEAMAKKKPKPAAGLMPCLFKGGTSDQQDIVNKAHQNGYNLTLQRAYKYTGQTRIYIQVMGITLARVSKL